MSKNTSIPAIPATTRRVRCVKKPGSRPMKEAAPGHTVFAGFVRFPARGRRIQRAAPCTARSRGDAGAGLSERAGFAQGAAQHHGAFRRRRRRLGPGGAVLRRRRTGIATGRWRRIRSDRDRAVDQDRAVPVRRDQRRTAGDRTAAAPTSTRQRRAPSEFKSLLATAQANARRQRASPDQMLKQFMQWGQKPAPTAP